MRRMLVGLSVIAMLGLTVACQSGQTQLDEAAVQSVRSEIDTLMPQLTVGSGEAIVNHPVMVVEGNADLNGVGKNESVQVWLMKGKEVTSTDPGPFQGTYFNGQFVVVATGNDDKETARFSLNDLFEGGDMSFSKDLPDTLQFEDYNGDGDPDFTIGQWAGSNGNIYALMTIGSNGFRVLEKNIYSANHYASIRFSKIGNDAFVNKYYDQQKGTYMDVIHRWKDGAFIADPPIEANEIHSAGVAKGSSNIHS
jgi:hypothetical protein